MDGTGTFAGEQDADVSGVDTAFNVGNDERRMHVRAYNYWVSLLDGRDYPSIEDLDPENLHDFGPNSVLLDFTGGIENPAIAYLGPKLRVACELEPDVSSVADIPSRSLLSRLTDHYMQIIANRAPIGFEAEFTNDAGQEVMYRGILMPFSSDDDTIDFIYGVINWKESADEALAESLVEEVSRALTTPEAPRARPTSPAWADGPKGEDAAPLPERPIRDDVLSLDPYVADEDDEEIEDGAAPIFSDVRESLADWLAAARASADAAGHADLRSRVALYRALGEAYDFALTADERPDEYEELLADCRIAVQPRAPMTPIVKLVFGVTYDKTRLAEYALVLGHGRRAGIARGAFTSFVEGYAGGLKAIVNAERRLKKPASNAEVAPIDNSLQEKARALPPLGMVELTGDSEFVVLIARRVDAAHVAVLGEVGSDQKAIDQALRKLVKPA
jgi:hypothetical protein